MGGLVGAGRHPGMWDARREGGADRYRVGVVDLCWRRKGRVLLLPEHLVPGEGSRCSEGGGGADSSLSGGLERKESTAARSRLQPPGRALKYPAYGTYIGTNYAPDCTVRILRGAAEPEPVIDGSLLKAKLGPISARMTAHPWTDQTLPV